MRTITPFRPVRFGGANRAGRRPLRAQTGPEPLSYRTSAAHPDQEM